MSFADDVNLRTVQLLDNYAAQANSPEVDAQVLRWKLSLGTALMLLATGANPQANLVDAIAFTVLRRLELELLDSRGELPGGLSKLLPSLRTFEATIWEIASGWLTQAQRDELRLSIEEWHQSHPLAQGLSVVRPQEYAMELRQKARAGGGGNDSVFSFLTLDPVLGLDPAVREVTQARLFAERAMYTLQRMPTLLRWQAELLCRQTFELPEIQTLLTNASALTASADRISRTAAELPDRISAERQAVLAEFAAQEGKLRALAEEIGQTLEAGQNMSTSLDATLKTFDALMKRFGVGEERTAAPAPAGTPPSRPFDIRDYGDTAQQITAMAAQLEATLHDLEAMLDSPALARRKQDLEALVNDAELRLRRNLNYAFTLAAILVLFGFVCAGAYRVLLRRLHPTATRSVKE